MKMMKLGVGCLSGLFVIGAIFVGGESASAMQGYGSYHHPHQGYNPPPNNPPRRSPIHTMHAIHGRVHAQTDCTMGHDNEIDCRIRIEGVDSFNIH